MPWHMEFYKKTEAFPNVDPNYWLLQNGDDDEYDGPFYTEAEAATALAGKS